MSNFYCSFQKRPFKKVVIFWNFIRFSVDLLFSEDNSGDDINAIMYGNFISFCKKYLP